MTSDLAGHIDKLTPANHRLVRELVFKLLQLQKAANPEAYDEGLEVSQFVNPWLERLLQEGKSPWTIRAYTRQILQLLKRYPSPTQADITNYVTSLIYEGKQPANTNAFIWAAKSFFTFCSEHGHLAANPAARIKPRPLPKRETKSPPPEDVHRLLSLPSLTPRDTAMLHLFIDCGLRLDELLSLEVNDLDLAHMKVTVIGKGNKQRSVPISPATRDVCQAYLRHVAATRLLFPGKKPGRKMTQTAIHLLLKHLCRQAGIQTITAHQLRHYFATQALSKGASLKAVSRMLGHAHASTTADIYWHVIDEQEIIDQHTRYSPIASL
ncbi:MAG: hypothetical protein D4R82_05915 [Dehalococcoidia bacterium]|nr:MAG: hypothetical protein D4R82_05915 [Dehalococcoidia bacterium]